MDTDGTAPDLGWALIDGQLRPSAETITIVIGDIAQYHLAKKFVSKDNGAFLDELHRGLFRLEPDTQIGFWTASIQLDGVLGPSRQPSVEDDAKGWSTQ